MQVDPTLSIVGLVVGLLVGLTGMGGGALLTPILVLFFRVSPLAAVSSDLVTSLIMKPVGGAVHLRHRTVHWPLVGWLTVASVPSAFAGAVVIGSIGHTVGVEDTLKMMIGIALLASVAMTVFRQVLDRRIALRGAPDTDDGPPAVRPLRTVLIGVIGGFAVGLTSVGAGSLIIALLLLAYPTLRPAQLVGTDIVQAVPLVAAATLGHLIFGDVQFALATSVLLGALPGVYVGARLSAQGPAAVIRPVIAAVLLASALSLLHAGTTVVILGAVAALVTMVALGARRRTAPAPRSVDEVLEPVA